MQKMSGCTPPPNHAQIDAAASKLEPLAGMLACEWGAAGLSMGLHSLHECLRNSWEELPTSASPLGPNTMSATTATSRASGAPTPKNEAAMIWRRTRACVTRSAGECIMMQMMTGPHTFRLSGHAPGWPMLLPPRNCWGPVAWQSDFETCAPFVRMDSNQYSVLRQQCTFRQEEPSADMVRPEI